MRRNQYSLSGHLVLSISVMLAILWAVGVGLAIHVMRGEFDEVFDSGLQETTERLAPLVVDDFFRRDTVDEPYRIAQLRSDSTDEYLTYQVRDASGRVLMHSHNVDAVPYPAPLVPGFWSEGDRRFFTVATIKDTLFIQVADSLEHRQEATLESAIALLFPILFLLPIAMLATGWIVVRATKPIDNLRVAISARDGANLEPINIAGLPAEIATIPLSVNTLLGRLKLAMQAERDLAANSAHELRTPLAGALAQAELLAGQLERPSDKARADRVLEALRRLSQMLEKLLQLSRAEAGIGLADSVLDLSALFDLLVEEFRRTNPSSQVEIVRKGSQATIVRRLDPDAFAIAFNNILENAQRYGMPGRPITIILDPAGRITVSNVVVDPLEPDVNIYRRRFRRGNSRAPGSGLGLAIVDTLMSQMGGALVLGSRNAANGDVVFECTLDLDASNAATM